MLELELLGVSFDEGGVLSLAVSIIVVVIIMWKYKTYSYITERLNSLKKDPLKIMIVVILISIGLTAVWITIRAIGFFAISYILTMNYNYQSGDIFTMLALILTANLCFTLFKALTLTVNGKNQSESARDRNQNDSETLKGLIDVSIQAVIIGFMTFAPKHSDSTFLKEVSANGYVLIVLSMIVSIVVLVFVRHRLGNKKKLTTPYSC